MLKPSFHYPLVDQLVHPRGFWSSAGDPSFCKIIRSDYLPPVCGPSGFNGANLAVTAPSVPDPGVRSRKSNLDLNGRIVKRGCTVSLHGYRGKVSRVRSGYLYPVAGSPLADLARRVGVIECESVQVVSNGFCDVHFNRPLF